MRATTKLMALGLGAAGLLLTSCEVPGGNPPGSVDLVIEDLGPNTAISSLPAIVNGTFFVPQGPTGVQIQEAVGDSDTYVLTSDEEISVRITCLSGDDLHFEIESPELSNDYGLDCADDISFALDGHAYITVSSNTFLSGIEHYSFRLDRLLA
jgi:hypothetical protein